MRPDQLPLAPGFRVISVDDTGFQSPLRPIRPLPCVEPRQFCSGRMMAEALLGLGGNVGDVRASLDRAVACLCEDGRAKLIAQSRDFRTPPWGVEDQPPYVNRCIAVRTELGPQA